MLKTDKPDLSQFTMDKYVAITKYKTSYHTFQMPVTLALLMTGVEDPETHRQAKTILLEMGEFFQIQVSRYLSTFFIVVIFSLDLNNMTSILLS